MTTRRVLLGDDHAPTRAGVRLALEGSEFAVVAEAHDARSAVAAALRDSPDICVLDVRMPGGGIGAAAEIAARLSNVVIVMLTVSRDDEDLFARPARGRGGLSAQGHAARAAAGRAAGGRGRGGGDVARPRRAADRRVPRTPSTGAECRCSGSEASA